MKSSRMIALAAAMAGSLVSVSAHASDSDDAYRFFARERERAVAQTEASPDKSANVAVKGTKDGKRAKAANAKAANAAAKAKDVASAPAQQKETRSSKRTVLAKPAEAQPEAASTEKVAVQSGRTVVAREQAGGKPLGYHSNSRERVRELIAKHATANGIPFALGDAVVRVESRYQPHVTNRGALGLMQIKHATARGVGYGGSARGLMDPETNIKYGMKYLAQAYRLANGDTCGTVMRYQSGHYAKRINRANLAYCSKVRTIMASLDTKLAMAEPADRKRKTQVQ